MIENLYIRKDETISGQLDDEMVMMDIQKGKYFSLNPVATRIWELVEIPRSQAEICRILQEEYEVEPSRCSGEVMEFLEELVKMGLVLITREQTA